MTSEAVCQICYENYANHDSESDTEECIPKERLKVKGCIHAFCQECLTNHCKHAISVREIPIHCPARASDSCNNVLQEDQVRSLLCENYCDLDGNHVSYGSISDGDLADPREGSLESISLWKAFQQFQMKLHDPSLIECTRCSDLLHIDECRTTGIHPNDVTCTACGHGFCAMHGDAHLSKSCKHFRASPQDWKSERMIERCTKPCSHCKIPINKESGCDHIVCGRCNLDMCFKCGSHEHLTGEMVRSCSNCEQNYIDHRYIWRYRLTLCLSLPIYIPVCILHVVIMTALVILSCGCCCCLGCGIKLDASDESSGPNSKSMIASIKPAKAISTVLAIMFLPVIDLARQCGIPCCCGLELPGLEETTTSSLSMDAESDENDNENVSNSV